MDSGNSGSISSSGDEEYDSHAAAAADQSLFLNHPTHFGASHHHNHHPTLFDLSSTYLHSLPQTSASPHSMLNLDTVASHAQRSELANCTDHLATLPSSSSSGMNHSSLLGPHHQDNARLLLSSSLPAPTNNNNNNNAARNSKKRTRASRRAPTTVLTTDTTNFRSMVQEFTGIPAPPFSASSYSRRLDLLANSSSLVRSSASHHLDTATTTNNAFHPFAHKVHPNPFLLSSSSSSPPSNSRLLHSNMVDTAVASTTTNASSSATTANHPSSHHNNFHLPHEDLGLPYHQPQNMNLSMQNHPTDLPFNPPPPITLQTPRFNTVPIGFGAKSQAIFHMPSSLEDVGMSHGHQVNAHDLAASTGVSVQPPVHEHVASEGMPSDDGRRRDPFRSLDGKVASGGSCKLNFSAAARIDQHLEP